MKAATLPLLVVCLAAATVSIEALHSRDDRGGGHRDHDRNRGEDRDLDMDRGRIVIKNSGKIVNNGVQDGGQRDLQKQQLLDQLGYSQTLEEPTDMETLQRQRFLLEVLLNVDGELINEDLKELGQHLVVDERMYSGELDDDMLHLLQLCINGQALRKGESFHGLRPDQRRQLVGLYKLLVRASDWETFQRNACFARQHLNGVLFVNGLLLAVRDREDTRDLAVPAIHEVLPELFYDEALLQRVRGTDVRTLVSATNTLKPQLKDVAGHGAWGASQPKKTWQEWRQERLDKLAAMGKGPAGEGKLVIPVLTEGDAKSGDLEERISYLTHDLGLNNFWYGDRIDSLLRMRSPSSRSGGMRGQGPMNRKNDGTDETQGSSTRTGSENRDYDRKHTDGGIGSEARFNPYLPLDSVRNTDNEIWTSRKEGIRNKDPIEGLDIDVRKGLKTTSIGDERLLKVGRRTMNNDFRDNEEVEDRRQVGDDWLLRSGEGRRSNKMDDIIRIDQGNGGRIGSDLSMGVRDDIEGRTHSSEESREGIVSGRQDRLLKLSRRRMGQTWGSMNSDRQQSSEESREDMRRMIDEDTFQGRTTLNNDRLLKINRRRLNGNWRTSDMNSMEDTMSRQRSSEEDSSEGGRRQDWGQGQTVMDDDRVNPRRLDRNLGTNGDFESGENYSSNMGGNYFDRSLNQESSTSEESREETSASNGDRLLKVGRRRLPRDLDTSLRREDEGEDLADRRAGEIFVANLQQMVARLNLERLSHQLEEARIQGSGKGDKKSKSKSLDDKDMQYTQRLNRLTLANRVNRQALEQIQETERSLQDLVRTELDTLEKKGLIDLRNANIAELIGEILIGRISNTDRNIVLVWKQMNERLRQILTDNSPTWSLMSNIALQLRDPAFRYLTERIASIVRTHIERLPSYSSEELRHDGVQLNDVQVDELQTFCDTSDVDLINVLDQQELLQQKVELRTLERIAVARQRRLNHKAFTLNLDITADRGRRAVVRVFLGPKLDAVGREIPLNERRADFLLLDAFATDLVAGRNVIKRRSSDIAWTSRDSTPLTQIYRQVLEAIDGSVDLQLGRLAGNNNCRFPQRLLLPRGLPQGLPMQLFVIISEAWDDERPLDSGVCGMGIASVGLDALPLGFPLDRNIDNDRDILLPNVILKDVSIYHDEKQDSKELRNKN